MIFILVGVLVLVCCSCAAVVIAATNHLETLDKAILRPGRYTRKVNVPPPDIEGRRAILAIHAVQGSRSDPGRSGAQADSDWRIGTPGG